MSKKRGLSLEEKRERVLEIFHSKKDVFLLKELEKIAYKEKGVVTQSVKDVVQSLVDDDLISSDKIGSSIYYWGFPSSALVLKKNKLADLTNNLQKCSSKLDSVRNSLNDAASGKKDTPERNQAIKRLKELKTKREKLDAELTLYKENDPKFIQHLESETILSRTATNRWTDNIFSLHSWVQTKFPSITAQDLNKQFGIPDDLDYIE